VVTNEFAHGYLSKPNIEGLSVPFRDRATKQSHFQATLVSEPGSSSSFFPEDDEEAFKLLDLKITTGDTVHENAHTKRSNPAMADTNFLRKRTATLLELAQSDKYDAALSSRGMKVERKTFNFLLDAWAFSGEDDAAIQAMNLLKCMEETGRSNPLMKPDVRSYTKAINAISRSASLTAGEEAERILANMESMYNSGDVSVKPNTFTYTAVMEAHANSGRLGSAQRVEELCELMVSKYKAGDPDVLPTARAFNAAIHAYGKAGDGEKAQSLFDRMEQLYNFGAQDAKPTTVNFNTLISAWANCDDDGSAQRAGQVLDRMEMLFKRGSTDVVPTTVSYNAVIDAYAKSGEEDAPKKAQNILNHMTYLYESNENPNARPNTRSFNSVINGKCLCCSAVALHFSTLTDDSFSAWAKSGESEATAIAENLLDTMTRMSEEGNEFVHPDVHSFCTVINGTYHNVCFKAVFAQ
jgi:pentatricopeptide repeat protein